MSKSAKIPTRKRVSPQNSVMEQEGPADPVEVFCRVRPLNEDEDESCCNVMSDTMLQIAPPECSLAFKSGHRNAVSLHVIVRAQLPRSFTTVPSLPKSIDTQTPQKIHLPVVTIDLAGVS